MVLSVAMAEQLGQRSTSAILAYGLEANLFIRKLMVPLTRDGIIVSTLGRNGSIHLGRSAESITLRDIYVSVIEDKKLWASRPMRRPAAWSAPTPAGTSSLSPTKQSCWMLARHTVASALEKVKKAISAAMSCCQNWIACIKKRTTCRQHKKCLHSEGIGC